MNRSGKVRGLQETRSGLSTRDIEAHLGEIYGVKVGRDLISKVTDAVMDDARAWQSRPLDDVYPVVFLDALVLKIRDGGSVQRRACYLALAINMDGEREVLGMWFQGNEGAKFWMQVLTDLKQRGVQDILEPEVRRFPTEDAARELIYLAIGNAVPHTDTLPEFRAPCKVVGRFGVFAVMTRRGDEQCRDLLDAMALSRSLLVVVSASSIGVARGRWLADPETLDRRGIEPDGPVAGGEFLALMEGGSRGRGGVCAPRALGR